jgi:sugar transferase (PEP-CTERM/EpsH1 system associated)
VINVNCSGETIVVAHVVYSFDKIGGLENGLVNILNALSGPSFKHVVCSLKCLGDLRDRVTATNVYYYSLDKREGNDLSIPIKLFSIFRKECVDVVHLRNWVTLVEGYLAAKMARASKVIYSEHGRHFEDIDLSKKLNTAVKKILFNRVDTLLTVSSQLSDEMKDRYGLNRRIEVIQNGVDVNKFFPARHPAPLNRFFGFDPQDFIVGSVARLDAGKNFEEFISNFIAYQKNNIKLVIVGDGPEYNNLKNLIDSNDASDRIILLGHRDDIPPILQSFNLFVLPSSSEGLSNVLLEAMATGLPLVAYNVGGNPELIDNDGGYLLGLKENDAFQNCISLMAENPFQCEAMGKYNRKKAEIQFSIDVMIIKYKQMYMN